MKISIIVPVYNGEKYVDKFLRALINLEAPGVPFEVIIVDNNSNDGTYELLKNQSGGRDEICILSFVNEQSSYAARNYGVPRVGAMC